MDLAQSILKELITLQTKNETLARIITKLEHESDIIIRQFETKIEELQKNLKHEQDEKSRASRRYEAEIRDLGETKVALINEITNVRETFQAKEHTFEEEIRSLTVTLNGKIDECGCLAQEKDFLTKTYDDNIVSLQRELSDLRIAAQHDQELLSSQVEVLSETLKQERERFVSQLHQKEEELHQAGGALLAMDQRLDEYADREKLLEEQSRVTIDHLHLLINTERQIRSRELKERNIQVRNLEDELQVDRQIIKDLDFRIKKETEDAHLEISRLEVLLSQAVLERDRFEEESQNLLNRISVQEKKYESSLSELTSEFSQKHKNHLDQITRLQKELQLTEITHEKDLKIREDEITVLTRQQDELQKSLQAALEAKQQLQDNLTKAILQREEESRRLEDVVQSTESEKVRLQIKFEDLKTNHEQEKKKFIEGISLQENRYADAEQAHHRDINHLNDELKELVSERDNLVSELQSREDYYRDEISALHKELADLEASLKLREDTLMLEISVRDRNIQDLYTGNEALRSELDRVRHQYIRLQEVIRAEKDESVHALYREITALEDKLAGRNRDITLLSENILRLDAENTRLVQEASSVKPAISSPVSTSSTKAPKLPVLPTAKKPTEFSDPTKNAVITLVGELEDPATAPDAAVRLTTLGHDVVDHLIPLLHTGSIQRRVWIAVVLYEINDNRATLPLMRLLETPKVHFRELIWEAKNQYRTRIRVGSSPGVPVAYLGLPNPGGL